MSKISKEGFEQIQVIKNALDSMYDKLNKAVYVKNEGKIKDIEKQYESINLFNSVKDEFEAIAWTGSLLNIYDETNSIIKQIELAKELFKRKNRIFGSCWGLQVLVTAAGGKVRKNPKGREMIFARDIMINKVGENHQMYKNKMKKFDAFCSHLDEIETIPNGSKVLSENKHSKVQALSFKINGAEFWGTQYHPEFNFNIMSRILIARKSILVKENIFNNEDHADKIISIMEQILENKNDGKDLEIGEDILDKNIRNRELINWLNFIEKSK